jgi:hypothetical protein
MFIQAVGFATPMVTGVITSTLAGNGIRIGNTTTATDKSGNPSVALGPAGGGAQLQDAHEAAVYEFWRSRVNDLSTAGWDRAEA